MKRIIVAIFRYACFAGLIALPGGVALAQGASDKEIDRELDFAAALVKARFPDYAEKVAKELAEKYPAAKDRVIRVQIMSFLERGKFDEAEALFKNIPAESKDAMRLRLDFGDYYYTWGKLNKARESYGQFFKGFPNGPPAELKEMYRETAYKYAQMLLGKGDDKGAVEAFRYILMSGPEKDVERQVMMEMAELCLKAGKESKDAERKKFFDEAAKMCDKVMWGGRDDPYFGKAAVTMAHLKLAEGDKAGARKIIDFYMPDLKIVEEVLKREKLSLRASPMAQCRFLLGQIAEDEGRKVFDEKLAEGKKLLQEALQHYCTVIIKYPTGNWSGDAGQRVEDIAAFLKSKKINIVLPPINRSEITATQFGDARTLFQEQNYSAAVTKYVEVINAFPNYPRIIAAMGELAQCYVQLKDNLWADAVTEFIAERYCRKDATREEAGNTLLQIIAALETQGELVRVSEVNELFIKKFTNYSQIPVIIFRTAENKLLEEKYVEALAHYANIVSNYPKARQYVASLNRKAECEAKLNDYTNLIQTLGVYIKELGPGAGPAYIAASYRLAEAYGKMDQNVAAINEYSKLITLLTKEPQKYGTTADDNAKNRKILEVAMFLKPTCYSRLKKPADKVTLFQTKAIEGYNEFLKEFPNSKLGPDALSTLGTLLFVLNKPDEANQAYERLAREYPTSPQASNIVYAQGKSLLDIGQTDRAIEIFGKMLASPKNFTQPQFSQVGSVMLDAKQYETAIKFYEQNRTSTERAIWEAAAIGIAMASVELKKYPEAAQAAEELLAKYTNSGHLVEANFIISRAYAEIGQKAEKAQQDALFGKSIKAMNRIRKLSRDPQVRARADLEVATTYLLMGRKRDAIASFMRMLMFGDVNNVKVQPFIEEAFMKALPLLREAEMYIDILEQCEKYLKDFPQGKYVSQARAWRNDMKMKGIKSAEEEPVDKGEAPAAATPAGAPAKPPEGGPPPTTTGESAAPPPAPAGTNMPESGKAAESAAPIPPPSPAPASEKVGEKSAAPSPAPAPVSNDNAGAAQVPPADK